MLSMCIATNSQVKLVGGPSFQNRWCEHQVLTVLADSNYELCEYLLSALCQAPAGNYTYLSG